jgi:hypothetical protein
MNQMSQYYQKNQKNQDYLGHPLRQEDPSHRHGLNYQKNQYFQKSLNYPRHPRYLVFQAIPLHHHDPKSQNYPMNQMNRNLCHLNHSNQQNYYHQFH